MEAIRSCRLVVDTGMHALGWSHEQATKYYMLANTAMGEHDARTEVTRYLTWPGQATAYKVGERFIRKMRTLAESELKEQFDPRDFYDVAVAVRQQHARSSTLLSRTTTSQSRKSRLHALFLLS